MSFLLILDILVAAAMTVLGFIVIMRNARLKTNRIFFAMAVSVAAWIIATYYSNDASLSQNFLLAWNHLALFFPALSLYFMQLFVTSFAGELRSRPKVFQTYQVVLLSVYALSLTPFVIEGIEPHPGGITGILFGPLSSIYFAAVGFNAVMVFYSLFIGTKRLRGNDLRRATTIFWATATTILINLFTNVALPAFSGSFALTNVGPLSAGLIVMAMFYTIVRHKLFDIRLVIARSLGYLLSLAFVTVFFGFVVFGLANLIFNLEISPAVQILLSVTAAVVSMLFQKLQKSFAKVTNNLFYQDAYDPQELLEDLNKVLVSTIDIHKLVSQSSNVITRHMKIDYCWFRVGEVTSMPDYVDHTELNVIDKSLAQHRKIVTAFDYLPAGRNDIKRVMTAHNMGVIVRLAPKSKNAQYDLGYIMLGTKKSGNPYDDKDYKMIEALAGELVIAVQNALHFAEIQNFNVTLQEKVAVATKQLRATNQRLKALDETKDDFISMASHQLRTPLTSVKGYLSMVVEGDAGDIKPLQKQMLTQAYTSSQRMVYLISDLLNVSRLKTGKFVITPTKVSLAEIVEEEVAQLKETAAGRGISLSFDKPTEWPMTYLDDTKVRQVVMNFMDNAIYYTRPGGTVTIGLTETSDAIELKIKDDGIGVPKTEQRHLFTKFYRANNARQIRPDGTGLGLFMAKKVIVAQGGTLLFKSVEGKGSTFGFSFAKKTIAAPANDNGAVPEPISVI